MRKTLLSLLLLCLIYSLKAQQNLPAFNYVLQSPTTAAFTRYGEIPVDLSTGVPGISIPIYTLSEHGLSVPVSLSYHASGIKVEDIASDVGLGWTLNAGGIITRTILGLKDEYWDLLNSSGTPFVQRPPFRNSVQFQAYNSAQENQDPQAWQMQMYNEFITNPNGRYDFYSDRFYYSLGNGESGVFRRDFMGNDYKTVPYKPIKIRFYWLSLTDIMSLKIEMTTIDGTRYIFKRNRFDLWIPDKIVNASATDSIVYYSHYDTLVTRTYSFSQEFGAYRNNSLTKTEAYIYQQGQPGCELRIRENDNPNQIVTNVASTEDEAVLFDSIVGSGSVIRFTYAKDRQDATFATIFTPLSRLANIQVFSKSTGALIKNVDFSYNYTGTVPGNKRLMLAGIQTGAGGEEKYAFTYNAETMPEYFPQIPNSIDIFHPYDFWGYNNTVNSSGSYNQLFSDFAPNGSQYLFPVEERAKACILEEIKYPTGGKTVFEYESNRVPTYFFGQGFSPDDVPADGKVGGLRVKKISNYAYEGAVPQVKSYEYICELPKEYGAFDSASLTYYQDTYNTFGTGYAGNEVCGPIQTEYGTTHANICVSRPMGRYIGGPQAPVFYNQVTEYNGDANNNVGKTIYYYQIPQTPLIENLDYPRFCGPWDRDLGVYIPPLEKKEEYKNENGQYKLVRKRETQYTRLHDAEFSTGFNLSSDLKFHDLIGTDLNAFNFYTYGDYNWYFATLHFSDPVAYTALILPGTTSTYDYVDDNNYVKTTTQFSYNDYGQQTAATTTTSKGELLKTKFTYPVDYPTQPPYDAMIQKNIIAPVIEQSTYKSTTTPEVFLQSTKTNYNYWNWSAYSWGDNTSNQILPQTVETKKGNNSSETRIQYYSYDGMGNPVSVGKANDARESYIWGYNKTYPIAKVVNASDGQVAYTSFEDRELGNWHFTGGIPVVSDNTTPTGKLCLSLNGISLYMPNLSSSSSYIVSYWYKNGSSVNVTGNSSSMVTSPAKNGWVCVKRTVTGSASITITGSGYIDEVKLYPATAEMTTYTYEPLVGITAQCDATDRITYYEYDASGRLTLVRDADKNILKRICYNYQGQPETCGINTTPLWQPTGATRCKPCPQNGNYITNVLQQQEIDNNINSQSHGVTRWTDLPYAGNCTIQADWQYTGNTQCVTSGGQNTGEQLKEQKDVNPCSNFGATRWVSGGTNTTACPLPVIFQSADVSGNYFSQTCSAAQIAMPVYVSMPQGSYTSLINGDDATNKARQAAQQIANQSNSCVTVYVKLVVAPDPPGDSDQWTAFEFHFYSDAAGTNPITIPSNFTVNYKRHTWWTDDGGYYQEEGNDNLSFNAQGSAGVYVDWEQSLFCPTGNFCHHIDCTILPGNYVIIP